MMDGDFDDLVDLVFWCLVIIINGVFYEEYFVCWCDGLLVVLSVVLVFC